MMTKIVMKKGFRIVNISLGFMVVFLFAACTNKEPLLGKWKLIHIDYTQHLQEMDPSLRESFQEMIDVQGRNVLNKTYFDFQEKGQLKIISAKFGGGQREDFGSWTKNKNGDSLFLKSSDSEQFAMEISNDGTLFLNSGDRPYRRITLIRQ